MILSEPFIDVRDVRRKVLLRRQIARIVFPRCVTDRVDAY